MCTWVCVANNGGRELDMYRGSERGIDEDTKRDKINEMKIARGRDGGDEERTR